jgi:AcrR family transcriptional regulator
LGFVSTQACDEARFGRPDGETMLDRKPGTRSAKRRSTPADPPRASQATASPAGPEAVPRVAGSRDPGRTSKAILAAAIAEFSEKGFGGARIDAIAERAGINKRMLYHYYGDKEALYARALREIYDGIRSAERDLRLESLDPVAGIRQLATFTWHYFLAHPEFLSMLATENLNRASFLRRMDWVSTVNSPLVQVLDGVLRRGAAAGVFRPGLDPVEVYVTMTGIGYFHLSNRHTMSVAFARDFEDPALLARWGDHMAEVVLAWLSSVPGSPSAVASGREGGGNGTPKAKKD